VEVGKKEKEKKKKGRGRARLTGGRRGGTVASRGSAGMAQRRPFFLAVAPPGIVSFVAKSDEWRGRRARTVLGNSEGRVRACRGRGGA
jgi:hypothetical protein